MFRFTTLTASLGTMSNLNNGQILWTVKGERTSACAQDYRHHLHFLGRIERWVQTVRLCARYARSGGCRQCGRTSIRGLKYPNCNALLSSLYFEVPSRYGTYPLKPRAPVGRVACIGARQTVHSYGNTQVGARTRERSAVTQILKKSVVFNLRRFRVRMTR